MSHDSMAHFPLSQDSWQAAGFMNLWSPGLMILLVIISGLYIAVTGPWRERFQDADPVPRKKKVLFFTGILILYVGVGSPIDYYGHHYMFSAHMLQQSILYFILPPFILQGIPAYVYRSAFKYKWIQKLLVTNPIFATAVFNGIFSFYHYPIIFNTIMDNMLLMEISHTLLIITAFQMWWHITCPIEEYTRITALRKIAYIFLSGILLTPACALIIFAGTPIYEIYANAPQVLFPIMDDQQLGGVIMKIIQEIAFGVSLTFAFFEWYHNENPSIDLNPQNVGDNVLLEPSLVGQPNHS
jgi:putative membrane protein